MSVIQKVANRIQGRKRFGSTTLPSPAETSANSDEKVSFSSVNRQNSADFCVVDKPVNVDVERNESLDDSFHHDLNQVAEELFNDDYESEEPRLKPAEVHRDTAATSKPWHEASKDVYEQQLELLQDQLMTAMMDKQTMESELKKHKSTKQAADKEIEDLRKEIHVLSRRLKSTQATGLPGSGEGARPYAGGGLQVSTSAEGYQEVSMATNQGSPFRRSIQKKSYFQAAVDWIYEFLADFTDDAPTQTVQEESSALAYKKLKDNLQRLLTTSKPWRETGQYAQGVLSWNHTAESLIIFLLFMYSVWNGWVITLLLFIAVCKLTITYLHASGIAEQFGFAYPYRRHEVEEPGLANKLQLVKRVAETCQNLSGQAADSLEKVQNLFLWHHPGATQKLYFVLLGWFLASLFLSNSYILTFIGLGAGVKLFIIDNIYRKYPKVKAKYDTVHKMWQALPTNAQLYMRQSLTEDELRRSQSTDSVTSSLSDSSVTNSLAQPDEHTSFCQRFQLPISEHLLSSWETGKRCSIMDRDKPLSLTRSGRLFMTHRYMCFERMSHSARDLDKISILFSDVVSVSKAKPFAVLPGSGMSIEFTLVNGKKYLFSAILGRDKVYQNILDQGMLLGLPWGSDPVAERTNVDENDTEATGSRED